MDCGVALLLAAKVIAKTEISTNLRKWRTVGMTGTASLPTGIDPAFPFYIVLWCLEVPSRYSRIELSA